LVLTGEISKLRTIIFTIEAYNGIFLMGLILSIAFSRKLLSLRI
jgi:hypothetical protein